MQQRPLQVIPHLESRKVELAGITVHPTDPWMQQIARNVTMDGCGFLEGCRYLLHDRDTKFTERFNALWTRLGQSNAIRVGTRPTVR